MSVNNKQTNKNDAFAVTRRGFVKGSAALGALATVTSGLTLPFSKKRLRLKLQRNQMKKSYGRHVP